MKNAGKLYLGVSDSGLTLAAVSPSAKSVLKDHVAQPPPRAGVSDSPSSYWFCWSHHFVVCIYPFTSLFFSLAAPCIFIAEMFRNYLLNIRQLCV